MASGQLKVATYNANSIRARLGQVLDWLSRETTALESRGGAAMPGAAWKAAINNRF